ncbi:MAG TPA: hypothetical protein VLM40_05245 [Gemmata sp.]|nr:hypothetical protein [Gemmata sp.]
MPRKHAFLMLACVIALVTSRTATSQDPGLKPYYWPHRSVGIPIDVDRLKKRANPPSEIQLYYWTNGRELQKGPKLSLNSLQKLNNGRQGFLFQADRDGDYEFTVQWIYPDNTASPQANELSPQQRVIVDTTPPQVRVYPSKTGVAWEVTDENLDPDPSKLVLECRWPGQQQWTKVNEREFRPRDQFAWPLQAGKALEVRVSATDRAGHVGTSAITRVPPDTASGVGFPKTPSSDWLKTTPNLPQARVDFVNTLDFTVDYNIEHMGRSGVRAAYLFVQKNQGNTNWEFVKKFPVSLMPGSKESLISLPYSVKEEGTYGFYVIPESGAGKRMEDPRKGDPAMVHVVVDKTPPYVRITSVQVRPGGARGPIVEITWEAADPNLMPEPISLEWSTDASAAKWNEIKYRLKNAPGQHSGRYTWEVPDESVWKFYVRARAVDKAANTGEHIWGQDAERKTAPVEVLVDLENPSGSIERVRGGNSPRSSSGGSDSPPSAPVAPPPSGSSGSSGGPGIPALPGSGKLPEPPG